MKIFTKEFTLKKFNKQLKDSLEENLDPLNRNRRINHISLLVGNDSSKVSIILEQDNLYQSTYFGVHPSFDENKLNELIKQNGFDMTNKKQFWEKVSLLQEENVFSLGHRSDWENFELSSSNINKQELETILLGRAILRMASNFHVELDINEKSTEAELIEIENKLYSLFEDYYYNEKREHIIQFERWSSNSEKKDLISSINFEFIEFDKKLKKIYLKGIWPKAFIRIFEKNFGWDESDCVVIKSKSVRNINLFTYYKNWSSCYSTKKNTIYYNGVLPRVVEIKYDRSCLRSSDIKCVTMRLERTTFATVDMMDNPMTMYHPYFFSNEMESYFIKLSKFDRYEDEIQKNLYNEALNTDQKYYEIEQINRLNDYLSKSLNTHGIAVSANIETSDGYVLLGKRGAESIDSGEYYPSANGQAEFVDEHVQFYQKSVYEDIPTLNFDQKIRLDLSKEIQREAISELGIATFLDNWEYYGLSFLSIDNTNRINEGHFIAKRRMHFNVLTHNRTNQRFSEIVRNQKHATEHFESERIEGVRIEVSTSKSKRAWDRLLNFSMISYEHSGLVALLFIIIDTLFQFLVNGDSAQESTEFLSIIIDICLPGLFILIIGFRLWGKRKTWKLKQTKRYLINKKVSSEEQLFEVKEQRRKYMFEKGIKKMSFFTKRKSKNLNPVARALLGLYYLEKRADEES